MSETKNGKLYEIEATYSFVVYAANEQDAIAVASRSVHDAIYDGSGDPDFHAYEVRTKAGLHGPGDEIPYGGPEDFTCDQILAGLHTQPLPVSPPAALDATTIGAWLHGPHRVPSMRPADKVGAVPGWATWTNGQAALAIRDEAAEERDGFAGKIHALINEAVDDGADLAVATLDVLAPIATTENRSVRVGPWMLDPRLLRAFVWGPACAANDATVRAEWRSTPVGWPEYGSGNATAVVFHGSGWSALIMPRRDPVDAVTLARLDADSEAA